MGKKKIGNEEAALDCDSGYESASSHSETGSKLSNKPGTIGRRTRVTSRDPDDEIPEVPNLGEAYSDERWAELEKESELYLPTPPERATEGPTYLKTSLKELSEVRTGVGFAQLFPGGKSRHSKQGSESGENASESRNVEHDAHYLKRMQKKAAERIATSAIQSTKNFLKGMDEHPASIDASCYMDPNHYEAAQKLFSKESDLPHSEKTLSFEDIEHLLRFRKDTFSRAATTAAKDLTRRTHEEVKRIIEDMDRQSDGMVHARRFHKVPRKHEPWSQYAAGTRPDESEQRITLATVYPVLMIDEEDSSAPVKMLFRGEFVDQQTAATYPLESGTVSFDQPDEILRSSIEDNHLAPSGRKSFLIDVNSANFAKQWKRWENMVHKDSTKASKRLFKHWNTIASNVPTGKGLDMDSVEFGRSLGRAMVAEMTIDKGDASTSSRFNELVTKFGKSDTGRKILYVAKSEFQKQIKNLTRTQTDRESSIDENASTVFDENMRVKPGKRRWKSRASSGAK
jgi:hypothetical protein